MLKQIFIAIDQLINALFGGWADETLSSRAWRWHAAGIRSWPRRCIDSLFFWQHSHCLLAFRSEAQRLQAPPELRRAPE